MKDHKDSNANDQILIRHAWVLKIFGVDACEIFSRPVRERSNEVCWARESSNLFLG
jgi:hypothetical protein